MQVKTRTSVIVLFIFLLSLVCWQKPMEVNAAEWVKPYISMTSGYEEWEQLYIIDDNGVVCVDYKGDISIQYNPTTIAQYALACYNNYIETGDDAVKDIFLKQVQWLKTHYTVINDNTIGYQYDFPWLSYGLSTGWYSGLAQGQIISVFARAYDLTGDKTLIPLMVKSKNLMLLPVKEGGLMAHTPEGYIWVEEYPSEKPSLVLNGFVSTVLGLYDYMSFFPEDENTRCFYNHCIDSLKKTIAYYDTGDWLVYDRYQDNHIMPVNERYMRFQTKQMEQMYNITSDSFFLELYNKYRDYSINNYSRNVKIRINGMFITFSSPPTIIEGRTYVPTMELYNHLETASRGAFTANKFNRHKLPCRIIGETEFISLRSVIESVDGNIKWIPDAKTVSIEIGN